MRSLLLGALMTARIAAAAGAVVVDDTFANGNSLNPANDWIGLFHAGDPDTSVLAWHYVGSGNTGHTTFTAPGAGQYEFRYFLNDGQSRVASGGRIMVP